MKNINLNNNMFYKKIVFFFFMIERLLLLNTIYLKLKNFKFINNFTYFIYKNFIFKSEILLFFHFYITQNNKHTFYI